MRRAFLDIKAVKKQISSYKGQCVNLTVNHGRNKISNFDGTIEDTYPALFTVSVKEGDGYKKRCYSYSDVLCGQVKLLKVK
ncbi:MAG: ABC transporter permease [Clostridiales bacterium]|jgi:uncharacterized protein Veg|nr:ABC transporter permease [Clostridiales bacterium]